MLKRAARKIHVFVVVVKGVGLGSVKDPQLQAIAYQQCGIVGGKRFICIERRVHFEAI